MKGQQAHWLYLFSSNAEQEYVIDILETLALPKGSVQHYRYRLRWLDPRLRDALPTLPLRTSSFLRNSAVLACYLYQEELEVAGKSRWQWRAIYPIRKGTLIEAYRTGNDDRDVAHFFFKLEDYYKYTSDPPNSPVMLHQAVETAIGPAASQHYATLGSPLKSMPASVDEAESAFNSVVSSIPTHHLRSGRTRGLPVQYYPAFCFIRGLVEVSKHQGPDGDRLSGGLRTTLTPQYDYASHRSYYLVRERTAYILEFSYYFPWTAPEAPSEISLTYDARLFPSIANDHLAVASKYDSESWLVIPGTVERDTWSSLTFQTNVKAPANTKALNFSRTFPIQVTRRSSQRLLFAFVDFLGGASLAVGTASVALSRTLEWPYWLWVIIGSYVVWALLTLSNRLWRA